jgi:hypothetical protein
MNAIIRFVMAFAGLFFARDVFADDGGINVYLGASTYRARPMNTFVRATPNKPIYYQPIFFAYRAEGHLVDFYTKNPPMTARQTAEAEELLVKGLAAQGYRIATKLSPPSLIITFEWGSRAIRTVPYGTPDMQNYFLQISALDLKAAQRHKRVSLWSENIETPRWGHYFDEVLPTMIAYGTPAFGQPGTRGNYYWPATAEHTALEYYNRFNSKITTPLIAWSDPN